eukprot:6466548-Amphidinium_carterae.1
MGSARSFPCNYVNSAHLYGDLEWIHSGLRLASSGSKNPCTLCACNTEDDQVPWSDLGPDAAWRSQLWTNDLWMCCHDALPIVKLTGVEALFYDIMHTKHLGVDQYSLGSFIHYIIEEKELTLHSLWTLIDKDYKLSCKAAEIRDLLPTAVMLAENLLDQDDEVEAMITDLLRMSYKVDVILGEHAEEFLLKGKALVAFREAVDSFNMLNTQLRMAFNTKPFFHFTVKNHILAHIALQASEISPRCLSKESCPNLAWLTWVFKWV